MLTTEELGDAVEDAAMLRSALASRSIEASTWLVLASQHLDTLLTHITEQEAAHEQVLDLYSACFRRAGVMWSEAHPDQPLTLPDGARNIVWLMEQLRQVQAEAAASKTALEDIRQYWNRDRNDTAMFDACWHAIETADLTLSTMTILATSAYAVKVQRMEEALRKLQHDLEYWQTVPCISALLGEDSDEDPPCGCASCWAKQALPLVRAALAEGEG